MDNFLNSRGQVWLLQFGFKLIFSRVQDLYSQPAVWFRHNCSRDPTTTAWDQMPLDKPAQYRYSHHVSNFDQDLSEAQFMISQHCHLHQTFLFIVKDKNPREESNEKWNVL